jgi:hypothetical protein
MDVDAMPGEDVDGTHNQRDGLVTILVVARGQEGFNDTNRNGAHDADEQFYDDGEPFLDVDDDGFYTSGTDEFPCCDNDGNGKPDGPNARFDSDVWIGRVAYVLWTGEVAQLNRSGISPPGGTNDPNTGLQAALHMELNIADINFNPIAAGSGDELRFAMTQGQSYAAFVPPTGIDTAKTQLYNVSGIQLRNERPFVSGERVFVGIDRSDYFKFFWQWPFAVQDKRLAPTSSTSSICKEYPWAFEVKVSSTPVEGGAALPDVVLACSGLLAKLVGGGICP